MSIAAIGTTERRALVFTPMETDWRLIVEGAIHAEQVGYEAVVVPEGWGLDASLVLSEIARSTSRIRLVSGVLSIWGRTAATLAMTAATLDEVSDGRFTLGLGASTPVLAEQFHGTRFARPASRLSTTVQTVRLLLDGQRTAGFDGRPGLRLGVNPRPRLPIWVAGLGPLAVATAARSADGWFPVMIPRARLDAVRAAADPDRRSACQLVTGPMAFVANEPHDARASAEQLLGWYLTGMGDLYGDFVAAHGFGDEIAALRAANPTPRPGALLWPPAADPLLDQLAVHGDPATVAEQLRWWDRHSDLVTVTTGPIRADRLHLLIDACAPGRRRPQAPSPSLPSGVGRGAR